MKGKYLITTTEYFFAPNGKQYRAVFGDVNIVDQKAMLGEMKGNARAVNWYAQIGTGDGSIIVAGCQIQYAVKCDKVNSENVTEVKEVNAKHKKETIRSLIYCP